MKATTKAAPGAHGRDQYLKNNLAAQAADYFALEMTDKAKKRADGRGGWLVFRREKTKGGARLCYHVREV